MGALGPIPWTAIDHYAVRQDYTDDPILYDDFMYIIRQLDEEFLADHREKLKREEEKAKSGKAGSVRAPHRGPGRGRYIKHR